jgi:AraC-like DNA-binding protein
VLVAERGDARAQRVGPFERQQVAAARDHLERRAGDVGEPRTLTRATVAAARETPKQIIHGRIALEAARLLAHTDLAISAIGRRVDFRDPSNFSGFFANVTGETPTAFRRGQRPPAAVNAGASSKPEGVPSRREASA